MKPPARARLAEKPRRGREREAFHARSSPKGACKPEISALVGQGLPQHCRGFQRDHQFAGGAEAAQGHRAFHERPARRIRCIYAYFKQCLRRYQGKSRPCPGAGSARPAAQRVCNPDLLPGSEIAGIKEKAAGSERLVLSDPGVADRGMPAGVFQAHPKVRALQSTQGL